MIKVAIVKKRGASDHPAYRRLVQALASDGRFCIADADSLFDIPHDARRALVFGGDGTVLETAGHLVREGIDAAILGVNLGNLGFLTAFESDVAPSALLDALYSDACVQLPFLEASAVAPIGYALNDVVIKSEGARPVRLELYVDGAFVDVFHGDGLIIATAVGSTAYSLSAGGPVLAPGVDALVINPICAHSLHSRPLVVGGSSKIEVRQIGDICARVSLDGSSALALGSPSMPICVSRSQKCARFAYIKSDFYSKLFKKMNDWGRTENKL